MIFIPAFLSLFFIDQTSPFGQLASEFSSICMQQAIQPHSICISMLLDIPLILLLRLKSYRFVPDFIYRCRIFRSISFSCVSVRVCGSRKTFAHRLRSKRSIVEYCVNKADEVVVFFCFLFSQYRKCYHRFNFKGWKYRYIFMIGGHKELMDKGKKDC